MPAARVKRVDHPLVKVMLTQLRDAATPPSAFRDLVEEVTRALLIEALCDLEVVAREVTTPLEKAEGWEFARPIVLVPILRAGLGMLPAAQRLLPQASTRHLGLYRDESTLEPIVYYGKLEAIDFADHELLILDPMLATAGTAVAAIELLKRAGAKHLKMLAIIAAPEGIARLQRRHPEVEITVAGIDERLTTAEDAWPPGYILPGLGDAGDRQFAT